MDRFWLATLAGIAMLAAAAATFPLRSAPGAAAATTVNVDVGDNFFANQSPGSHTTTIGIGDTVHWMWIGTNGHSVTYDGCPANCLFDDPGSAGGFAKTSGIFDFTFNTPGTYNYHCIVHSGMTGSIVVQAAAATPTNPSSAATNTSAAGNATATRTATATGTTTVVATSTPIPAASSTPAPAVATPTHSSGSPGGVSQLPSTGAGASRERSRVVWASVALAAAGASVVGCSVVAKVRRRPAS